jgi:hypothetical protein
MGTSRGTGSQQKQNVMQGIILTIATVGFQTLQQNLKALWKIIAS